MRSPRSEAAVGFRSHSGWTMLIAVAGSSAAPAVVVRRRVELSRRTPKQPFHAAEGRPFPAAEALIRSSIDEANVLAQRALDEVMNELRATGHEPVASGLLLSAGRPMPALRDILASHALIHAAEGELFRDVLRSASRDCGLRLTEVRERELDDRVAEALPLSSTEVSRRLSEWGKALGPPWTQDEKRAALVAWLALVSIPPGESRRVERGTAAR